MTRKKFTRATPALFNAAAPRPQISWCFANAVGDGNATRAVLVDLPPFVFADDHVIGTGTEGFIEGEILRVGTAQDDARFELEVEVAESWSTDSTLQVNYSSGSVTITGSSVRSILNNVVVLEMASGSTFNGSQGEAVAISVTKYPELSNTAITVTSIDVSGTSFTTQFKYSSVYSFTGAMFVIPANSETGIPTTSLSPNRFYLSRGRRLVLCGATLDD